MLTVERSLRVVLLQRRSDVGTERVLERKFSHSASVEREVRAHGSVIEAHCEGSRNDAVGDGDRAGDRYDGGGGR